MDLKKIWISMENDWKYNGDKFSVDIPIISLMKDGTIIMHLLSIRIIMITDLQTVYVTICNAK